MQIYNFSPTFLCEPDYVIRQENKIIARSKGNEIIIDNDGDFVIKDRKTEDIIISKIRQN
jgi:hypothetical protein